MSPRNVPVFLCLIMLTASNCFEAREHVVCVSSSTSSQFSSTPSSSTSRSVSSQFSSTPSSSTPRSVGIQLSTSSSPAPSKCQDTITLEQLQQNTSQYTQSETTILFLSGIHNVNFKGSIVFTGNALTVEGNATTITCSNGSISFKFVSMKKVSMSNLTIINCTTEETAVLYFSNGNYSVTVYNVRIHNTKGAGVACVNVSHTTITGLEVITNYTAPPNNTNQFSYQNCPKDSNHTLQIKNSNFTNVNNFSSSDIDNVQKNQSAIRIYSLNCNGTVNISIEGSNFSNSLGSNLNISLNGSIIRHRISITNSFLNNGHAQRGGGLCLSIYDRPLDTCAFNTSTDSKNDDIPIVTIDSVTFDCNHAHIGAAVYLDQKNHKKSCHRKEILFRNSTFKNNVLIGTERGGVALHSINYILKGSQTRIIPQYKPKLSNCTFINNKVRNNDTEATGNGVLFINKNEYFGIENTTITNNYCSGILAVTSNLVFEGTTLLASNTAASGGGLLLCKNAIMYFRPNTHVRIVDNTVKHTGGGICVEPQCIQTEPRCFFQLDNDSNASMLSTISITIENNTAHHAGHNLYGGDVEYCYMLDDPLLFKLYGHNSSKLFYKIFNIPDKHNSSITSIPQRVCHCSATARTPECNQSETHLKKLYPGEMFNVTVVTVGQLDGTVPGTIEAKWTDNKVQLQNLEYYQKVKNTACKSVGYTPLTNATESITATLQLTAAQTGDISGHLKLSWFRPLNITVEILPCPAGFQLDQSACNCNELIRKLQNVKCTISNSSIIHKRNSKSWIGLQNKNNSTHTMIIENCPHDYCVSANISAGKNHLDQDAQCNFNRTGILCGNCSKGLSMVLGSHECRVCSNNYLSLGLLFALAGLALVFIITALNLTITEGTLSGIIFYANIVRQNRDIFDPAKNAKPFAKLLHVFIAWLNLDIGIPVCFYNGMDTYQKAWLHFIFPVYIWFITIAIIYLCKKSRIIAKLASKNAVKVLATLILLSYTKFTQAAVKVFSYANLTTDESNSTPTLLWLEDANIGYLQKKHLVLFIFGIICVAVSIPFTLILLFIKQLHCVSHLRLFRWVETLKPLLDAYTGPHTANGRFWSGLLLLVRIILSATGGISSLESPEKRSKIGLFVIILLISISKAVRPGIYSKAYLDYLETFFLVNLGTLYFTTLYYTEDYQHSHAYQVSVGLALFVFIGIVIYHISRTVRRFRCTAVVIKRLTTIINRVKRTQKKNERLRNFPPFVQFTEDREPLLADHED